MNAVKWVSGAGSVTLDGGGSHHELLIPMSWLVDDDALDLLVQPLHTVPESGHRRLGDGDRHQDTLGNGYLDRGERAPHRFRGSSSGDAQERVTTIPPAGSLALLSTT